MKYKVKWVLYDVIDKPVVGIDHIDSETLLSDYEVTKLLDNLDRIMGDVTLDGNPVLELLPNFYEAHTEATAPTDFKIIYVQEVKI